MRNLLLFIFVSISGCIGSDYNCCKDELVNYTSEISRQSLKDSLVVDISHFRSVISKKGFFANFGFQFLKRNDEVYVVFVNSSIDSLLCVSLTKKDTFYIHSTNGIIKKGNRYCNILIGDTLHLVNADSFIYTKCLIDSMFSLKEISSVNFSDKINKKKNFLIDNILINKRIMYKYPYLFLPYGRYGKRNGMDKKSTLRINLSDKSMVGMQDYPEKYLHCDVRENYPIIDIVNNKFIAVFQKDDNLYRSSVETNKLESKSIHINFPNNYMCFKNSYNEDLAYTSKYDLNDEQNVNLLYLNKKYYLIKRLRRESKDAPVKCAILIYNEQLNHVSTYYPQESLTPRLSIVFANGIGIINNELTKLIYYEFS